MECPESCDEVTCIVDGSSVDEQDTDAVCRFATVVCSRRAMTSPVSRNPVAETLSVLVSVLVGEVDGSPVVVLPART